ncbi:MAG: hypothetical protein ACOYD0_06745 [Candidatus Nanopelagicales bacterium]
MAVDVSPPSKATRWLPVAVAVAVAILSFGRIAIAVDPRSQIWFEDGLFLSCATGEDPSACVFAPYARYLEVVSRLLLAVVSLFPPALAGTVIVVLAVAVAGVAAGFVTAGAQRLGLPVWASVAVGLAIALIPDAGAETIGVLADLQWVLTYAAMWVVLPYSQATTRLRAGSEAGFVALTALSAPGTIALLPLVLARWVTRPEGRSQRTRYFAAPVALSASVLIQVLVYLASPDSPNVAQPQSMPLNQRLTLFDGFLRSVTVGTANAASNAIWWTASGIAFIVCIWLLWRNRERRGLRTAGLLIGLTALTSFALTVALRDPAPFRFWVPLGLMFFSMVAVTLVATTADVRSTRLLVAAAGLGVLILWIPAFPVAGVRVATSYSWPEQVSAAAARCATEPGLNSVPLRVGPNFFLPTGIYFSCRYLSR